MSILEEIIPVLNDVNKNFSVWPFWRHCYAQIESSSNLLKKKPNIFDFVEIPAFVTLFTAVNTEPVYFLKITEKEISDGTLTYTWGHLVLPGLRYFKGNYLKPVRSRKISFKKFDIVCYHNTWRSIWYGIMKTPTRKIATRMIPTGQFTPGKFPPKKIPIQDNSHLENSHPG